MENSSRRNQPNSSLLFPCSYDLGRQLVLRHTLPRDDGRLTPVEIAAIGTASLALILVVVVITRTVIKRCTRLTSPIHLSPSSSSSRNRSRNVTPVARRPETFTTWGFGYPSHAFPSEYPAIAPSPSTGQTTLVTPTSARVKKGWFGRTEAESPRSKLTAKAGRPKVSHKEVVIPMTSRPESEEMIMVTYEEGLAKLGLGRPHHILYPGDPSDPPAFEETRQAYPSVSPRGVPGRSGLRPERDVPERRGERVTSAERVREWARSPLNRVSVTASTLDSGVTRPGVAGVGAGYQHDTRAGGQYGRPTHQSTWLPSYYHTPDRTHPDLPVESELDYRMGRPPGASSASPGRELWSGNRI